MPGKVIGTSLNLGYEGNPSRNIDNAITAMKKISNGVLYYFSDLEEKNNYLLEYKYLKNVIFDDEFAVNSKK